MTLVNPQCVLVRIEQALRDHQVEPERMDLRGREVLRASYKNQRLSSNLYVSICCHAFQSDPISRAKLDEFLDDSVRYSINHKPGLPRGLQTGTATIAVAITSERSPVAEEWARRQHGSERAAIGFPVAVDASRGTVTIPRIRLGGAWFYPYMVRTSKRYLVQPLRVS